MSCQACKMTDVLPRSRPMRRGKPYSKPSRKTRISSQARLKKPCPNRLQGIEPHNAHDIAERPCLPNQNTRTTVGPSWARPKLCGQHRGPGGPETEARPSFAAQLHIVDGQALAGLLLEQTWRQGAETRSRNTTRQNSNCIYYFAY